MKNTIFTSLLLLLTACTACVVPGADNNESPKINETFEDPYDPGVDWNSCGGAEDEHPCNILSFDHDNQPFDLYTFFGRPIVVDLSAMWCGPCRSAAAHAQEVQDLYVDEDLVYITILVENVNREPPTIDDIRSWANEFGNVTSPVVAGNRSMLASSGTGTWGVEGWPTFYYIDREMVTRDIDRGYNEEETIYSIDWLLTL
ncbi:MAG: hypothetical protein CMI54_03040 [Parcubacteria group bacterium]|nr:hypothetical protein [Parcubacteria group bacterium]|tara:strand:- start:149 stop:751 length:603 start_codon:yes stop_codon:yes gene_type:complete